MTVKEYINSIGRLNADSEKRLLTAFKEVRYPKGFRPFKEHCKAGKAYLITEGIAHAFALKDGKCVTFWIGQEGDVIYPGQSMHYNEGEYGTVELLEDCVLQQINLSKLNEIYLVDAELANWGRLAAEKVCISLEKSILASRFKTALSRYEEVLNDYPGLVRRVPLGVLASYLNTSQENLSRIRRKIK